MAYAVLRLITKVSYWHTDSPGCARIRIAGDPKPASGWQHQQTHSCSSNKLHTLAKVNFTDKQ
eukprot:12217631-Ditylum_brightwellii.AAC.1